MTAHVTQSEVALTLRLLDRLDEAEAISRRAIEADPLSRAPSSTPEPAAGSRAAPAIPRKIMQYWDQKHPLDEISRLLRT